MFRSLSVLLLLLLSSAIQANDISVFTKDRVSTKLTKLINAGTWTLVDFWALDCSICLIEKPKIAEFDFTRPDLEVIGVNLDGWDLRFDVENYLIEHKVGYTNIMADSKTVYEEFPQLAGRPLRGTPTFLLFDKDKKLVAVNPGRLFIENLRNFMDQNS